MDVLVYLASRGGQIVHADELLEKLWSGKVVTSASLSGGVKRTVITLREGRPLALAELAPLGIGRRSLALSPEGTHLAYVVDRGDTRQLYLRQMDEFEAQPLDGTEGAISPFFSPDGQRVAFGMLNSSNQGTLGGIYQQGVDGSQLLPLVAGFAKWISPNIWAPDGVLIFIVTHDLDTHLDIWVAKLDEAEEPEPFKLTVSVSHFRLSPIRARYWSYSL